MKNRFTILVALGFLLPALMAGAQNSVTPTQQKPVGRVIVPEAPAPVSPTDNAAPKRPSRPERQELPPDLKEKVRQFKIAADAYLKKQEELDKQMKGATDEARRKIRDQRKESNDRWREQAKQFRQEARERLREIQTDFPSLREALEEKRPPRPGLD